MDRGVDGEAVLYCTKALFYGLFSPVLCHMNEWPCLPVGGEGTSATE